MKIQIQIHLPSQRLFLLSPQQVLAQWPVSTARNGAGEEYGSECTPRGWHSIRAMIGEGCPPGTVFKGRRPTGECYSPALARAHPGRDWILTRILWLSGLERGRNRMGTVDTMRRYIYIHGCPPECPMGVPESHGCIRMNNQDLIALFNQVKTGVPVWISDDAEAAIHWRTQPAR